ncbi:hypothetical protein V8G54_035442 [Vigna mungo]|uniref:Uncharacterized protein n=1 Tax=Vigna mungo TaxID=3915 RepID=A0AAQ3RAX4_VIGMU
MTSYYKTLILINRSIRNHCSNRGLHRGIKLNQHVSIPQEYIHSTPLITNCHILTQPLVIPKRQNIYTSDLRIQLHSRCKLEPLRPKGCVLCYRHSLCSLPITDFSLKFPIFNSLTA